jgi:hypothetical protein
MIENELLNVEQVAAILKVRPNCVYRYHAAGLIRTRHNRLFLCTLDDAMECYNKLGTPEFKRRIRDHLNKKKQKRGRPAGSPEVRRLKEEGKI